MSDSPLAPFIAISDLVHSFQSVEIPYLIGGSVASSLFGRFRTTNDIDCLYRVAPDQIIPLIEKLEEKFIVDSETLNAHIRKNRTFNIIHEETFIKVDLFTAYSDFHLSELERAIDVRPKSSPCSFRVATAEDILLAKLQWLKDTNLSSERQLHDIEGIVALKGADLDIIYLEKWAGKLGVNELLHNFT